MANRPIYLIKSMQSTSQRGHFAIFVPSLANPNSGTLIHVVGTPMSGYVLQFRRNYSLKDTTQLHEDTLLGGVESKHVVDAAKGPKIEDATARDELEVVASQVAPPPASENFMAPVNDTTNRRCQEWTMDYIGRLVQCGYLPSNAIQLAQSKRDPPNHGVGLKPVAGGRGCGR